MTAQAKVKPVNPHHLTAKQLAADKANLKKARAVAAHKPRTAKQKQAARQNLVKARSAQKSRRAGKAPVVRKKPQAPDSQPNLGLAGADPSEPGVSLHLLPVCAAVAVAASLEYQTGILVSADDIWRLHLKSSGSTALADLLGLVAVEGLAGHRLESFHPWDPGVRLDGLIYGVQLPGLGYHAVVTVPGGMLSWDTVLPLRGEPEEAWMALWAGS
jgi:hypothetical protein